LLGGSLHSLYVFFSDLQSTTEKRGPQGPTRVFP
jgi:hypothetical protein